MIASLVVAFALTQFRDARFVAINEDWVIDHGPHKALDAAFPARTCRLIRQLGAKDWGSRETAEEDLIAMGPAAYRPLLWGRRFKDPEIRNRCERLLDDLFLRPCLHCAGPGYCPDTSDDHPFCPWCDTFRWLVEGRKAWCLVCRCTGSR